MRSRLLSMREFVRSRDSGRPSAARGVRRRVVRLSVLALTVLLLISTVVTPAIPAYADHGPASAFAWAEPSAPCAGQPVVVKAQVHGVRAAWLEYVPVVNDYAQLVDYPYGSRVYTLNVEHRDGSFRSYQTRVDVQSACGYTSQTPFIPYYGYGTAYRPVPGLAIPQVYPAFNTPFATVWAEPGFVYAGQPVLVRAQVRNVQAAWLENVPVVNDYAQLVDQPCGSRTYTLNVQHRDGSYRAYQTRVDVQGAC